MELNGKTAVITGACGAIGKATALGLQKAGATCILVDRETDALNALARELGGDALSVTIDLSSPAQISTGIDAILKKAGKVDILVNNAGILSNDKLAATNPENWRHLMAINLDAALLLTQAFVPGMVANGWGRIINMSSFAWKSGGLTAGTAYSVSKASLVGLTFSTAREFAGTGVTANAIAPAYVMSPMIMEQLTEEARQAQLKAIPVGRFCQPEEVAHTVNFLASPLAGFITGEVIDMNGGLQFD